MSLTIGLRSVRQFETFFWLTFSQIWTWAEHQGPFERARGVDIVDSLWGSYIYNANHFPTLSNECAIWVLMGSGVKIYLPWIKCSEMYVTDNWLKKFTPFWNLVLTYFFPDLNLSRASGPFWRGWRCGCCRLTARGEQLWRHHPFQLVNAAVKQNKQEGRVKNGRKRNKKREKKRKIIV